MENTMPGNGNTETLTPTKRRTLYLAGPMTGLPDYNRAAFAAAEEQLAESWHVLNPADIPDGLSYEYYIRRGIDRVFQSDALLMLDGWERSKGARAEHALAVALGKEIFFKIPLAVQK